MVVSAENRSSIQARPSEWSLRDALCLMNGHREFAFRTFGGDIGLPTGTRLLWSLIAGRVTRVRLGIILSERK